MHNQVGLIHVKMYIYIFVFYEIAFTSFLPLLFVQRLFQI